MLTHRTLGSLFVIGVICAIGATAPAAGAAAGDVVYCTFEGLAGNLTPAIPNVGRDAADGNPFDIEQGSYNFNGDGTCAGKLGATVFGPSQAFPQNASIVSNGLYDNIVCGSGAAHDQAGTGTTIVMKPGSVGGGVAFANVGYEIIFWEGDGRLLIGSGTNYSGQIGDGMGSATGKKGPPHSHHPVAGSWAGSGHVHITPGDRSNAPAQPPNDPDNCGEDGTVDTDGDGGTDTFEAAGAFSMGAKL